MSESDQIYSRPLADVKQFIFNEQVARCFEDMISRSVPGYHVIEAMIGVLAKSYVTSRSQVYDLGCSLGASILSMCQNIDVDEVRMISVDNSQEMLNKCHEKVQQLKSKVAVDLICDDVQNIAFENASMAVMNFTLQFIDVLERKALLQKIYDGLNSNGIFVLSEKIKFDENAQNNFQIELHESFKKLNGYSDLEIAQKRASLENVLIPETLADHEKRLRSVGFRKIYVWFQCFNFMSMVAIKE